MLQGIARLAIAAPRRVIAVALLVMVGTAIFGIPVIKSLSAGGLHDPTSESSQAAQAPVGQVRPGRHADAHQRSHRTAARRARRAPAQSAPTSSQQLQASPYVSQVTSAWTAPPSAAQALISKDDRTGLIVAGITGGENERAEARQDELADQLVHDRDGVTVRAGGEAMIYWQVNGRREKDLLLMESIAMPLSFVVLVWVFGGLVAAALPMAVGGFAILGSMAVLHAITLFTDVSIFALNLTVAMGLALAIDYTLLILSRYRDELAERRHRDAALIRTMATAGRTVLFSAMTVALSMVAMVLFPLYFLKSFAYAGMAVVAFAAFAAIVVTPAAIALLGDRLDRSTCAGSCAGCSAGRSRERDRWSKRSGIAGRSSSCATRCRSAPRSSRCCSLLGAPFLGSQVGLSRRPGAARLALSRARSAISCAATSPSTRRPTSPS